MTRLLILCVLLAVDSATPLGACLLKELSCRCNDVLEFDQVRKLSAEVVAQLWPLEHVLRIGTAQLAASAGSGQSLRAWLYVMCRALALWTTTQHSESGQQTSVLAQVRRDPGRPCVVGYGVPALDPEHTMLLLLQPSAAEVQMALAPHVVWPLTVATLTVLSSTAGTTADDDDADDGGGGGGGGDGAQELDKLRRGCVEV
eukprot:COSAG01_NODE_2323_length_7908_cov_43.508388_11_plen_201_part_00